jgi:hypothetical protein
MIFFVERARQQDEGSQFHCASERQLHEVQDIDASGSCSANSALTLVFNINAIIVDNSIH